MATPDVIRDLRRAGAYEMAGPIEVALDAVIDAWLARAGSWPHIVGAIESGKHVSFVLADVEGVGLAAHTRVGALALPRVAGTERTTWAPASRAEALRRLAPSSILQLPFISPGPALARMAELALAVPVYRLELGTDLERIPARVAGLAEAVPRCRRHPTPRGTSLAPEARETPIAGHAAPSPPRGAKPG